MAAPLVLHDEWANQIKALLGTDTQDVNNGPIPRVAKPLLDTKKEAYIPQFMSLGPYHHSDLAKDIDSFCGERKISTAETYKGEMAATLSWLLGGLGKTFESIVEMIELKRRKIEHFYQWSPITNPENSQKFNLMMAVDSSFLVYFLVRQARNKFNDEIPEEMIKLSPLLVCIKCDILKLENQLPIDVVKEVFEMIAPSIDLKFNHLLKRLTTELCPFVDVNAVRVDDNAVNDAPHLLGCLHALVSPLLDMPTYEENILQRLMEIPKFPVRALSSVVNKIFGEPRFERPYEIALNARKLVQGGIVFKADTKIQFDKVSRTLYLPQIDVWEIHTEVFLRNMVAMEFNDTTRGNAVMQYVSLMDCLIQTAEDVRVLRRGGVINSYTLTDGEIAKMWNDLGQPFFTGHMGPNSHTLGRALLTELKNKYWETKIIRMLWGLFDGLSNWKFLATVAAFLLFVMTAIQTYCSLYSLYHASLNLDHMLT